MTPTPLLNFAGRADLIIAQSRDLPLGRMILPMGITIALAGILLGVLSIVRRKMRAADQSVGMQGFTLSSLRQMRAEGKLTDEEFEKARAKLVSSVQASLKKPEAVEPLNVEPK